MPLPPQEGHTWRAAAAARDPRGGYPLDRGSRAEVGGHPFVSGEIHPAGLVRTARIQLLPE